MQLALLAGAAGLTISARCIAAPLSLVIAAERTAAAADCVDGATLMAKVERVAERQLASPSGTDVIRVMIRFDRVGSEYRADLEFRGPKPGERSLRDRSDNCGPLGEAAAVAIALLLDREIERREREATELPRAAPTIKITRSQIEPRRAKTESLFYSAIEGGAHTGFGGRVAPSFALDFGVEPSAGWLFESTAWATLPKSKSYATGEVRVSLLAGALRGCRVWGKVWQSGPCAAVTLGRLHGAGHGFDESLSSNLLWTAIGGSWLLQRTIGRDWQLGVHALAWIPLREQRFAVQNLGTAWTSTQIVPGLSVRLGFRFR